MDTLIIYHSRDLDGWCSGAIAYRYYKMLNKDADVALLGYDYGDEIPIKVLDNYDRLVMLDVSFPIFNMLGLIKNHSNFIWIDHHKSAINGLAEEVDVKQIDGILNTKYAACELAWRWFYPDTIVPDAVEALGMYDTFRHKGKDNEKAVINFQYAARAKWTGIQDILDTHWFFDVTQLHIAGMAAAGEHIHNYLCVVAKQIYEKRATVDFDGFSFAVVNSERINPINFNIDYHADGYDGFACYWDTPTGRSWSLYNDDDRVDCSVICKVRDGGGHKGAAGFVQAIPFPPATHAKSTKDNETHGYRGHPLYPRYREMINRCHNSSAAKYPWYGEKGITVCNEWRNSIVTYLDHVVNLPDYEKVFTHSYTLDRIDPEGNYEPKNVRWASKSLQAYNIKVPENELKVRGVFRSRNKFCAKLGRKHLGTFDTLYEAAKVRHEAEVVAGFIQDIAFPPYSHIDKLEAGPFPDIDKTVEEMLKISEVPADRQFAVGKHLYDIMNAKKEIIIVDEAKAKREGK